MSIIKKTLDDVISGYMRGIREKEGQCLGEQFHRQLKIFVSICLKYVFPRMEGCHRLPLHIFKQLTYF